MGNDQCVPEGKETLSVIMRILKVDIICSCIDLARLSNPSIHPSNYCIPFPNKVEESTSKIGHEKCRSLPYSQKCYDN